MRQAAAHSLIVARRNLLQLPRTPQLLVFTAVQPVMFVLLFSYVFGGAIRIPGLKYIDFLIPGIVVQTVAFGTMTTAVGLAEDLSKGIVDRFRSLPISRVAVIAGRVIADAARTAFTVLLIIAVGSLIGFRFHAGPAAAVGVVAIGILFGFAFSWVAVNIGLRVGNPESAQAASFLWLFPLTFASSAFVPPETMPRLLRAFAEANPITKVIDALRVLVLGGPAARAVLTALAWIVGILFVFAPLAVRRFRRM
ncbi:MAG TPA: ABC transporter permease [Actinomycetota bacterium]|nr:ABC transporter permease [Actinomycetota bacterium]